MLFQSISFMRGPFFFFLLLGPVGGAFGFIAADQLLDVAGLMVSPLARPGTSLAIFGTIPFLWLYSVILAYPIALLPALLCAALYARTIRSRTNIPRPMRASIGGVIGALIAAVFGGLLFHPPGAGFSFLALTPWAAAGALGGAVSGMLHRPVESARDSGHTARLPRVIRWWQ